MNNPSLLKNPYPLDSAEDLDPLMEHIGDSKIVLLGEASHGTHEYYTWRAKISQRLIEEKGFHLIAVEGDWPDTFKINNWVKNRDQRSIQKVLRSIEQWPTWMWANWEVIALADWLRSYNKNRSDPVGFYGLDLYSLWDSMDIIYYNLKKNDRSTIPLARETIACFAPYRSLDQYRPDPGDPDSNCQKQVVRLYQEILKRSHQYNHHPEAALDTEVNAMVLANAENYYRSLTEFTEHSWNIRDHHMLDALHHLLKNHGSDNTKVIVWAHNSHIGDARATDMADSGLINLGQLAREKYGANNVTLVGFGSYEGEVIAGRSWGAPRRKMKVPKAKDGSLEKLLFEKSKNNQLLLFDDNPAPYRLSECTIDHRAIGVVYNPKRESGNYVPSRITERYDAFLFIAKSKALHPLKSKRQKPPEGYPFGI